MPDKFAFVIADERGKPKKGDTGLIRSVCMRGRNVRDDSRRSKRRAKREQTIATNEWTKILGTQRTTDIGWTKHHIPIFGLLPSPATDLELVRFAGEVDDWSRAVLYKCQYMQLQSTRDGPQMVLIFRTQFSHAAELVTSSTQ